MRGELVSDDGRRCIVLDAEGCEHRLPASRVRARLEAVSARRPVRALVPLEEPRTLSTPTFDRGTPANARRPSVVRWSLEAIRDSAPLRSPAYLDHVREHPCCVCGAEGPNDAHHLGPRGMGTKTDDSRTASLCRAHHDEFHATRRIGGRSIEGTRLLLAEAMVDLLTSWMKREAMR